MKKLITWRFDYNRATEPPLLCDRRDLNCIDARVARGYRVQALPWQQGRQLMSWNVGSAVGLTTEVEGAILPAAVLMFDLAAKRADEAAP